MARAESVKPSLNLPGRVGYGVGMSGLWMTYMPVALYGFYFYTDVLGLSPGEAGLVFAIAVYWDAVIDVLIGWLASRTRTKIGQYRPYILFGAIPMAIALVLVFASPSLNGTQLFAYAIAAQLIFRTAFSLVYIPYTALIARLSRDANERATIASIKNIFQSAGSLLVAFYGLKIVEELGRGDDKLGFALAAGGFAVLSAIALLICAAFTREVGMNTLNAESKPVEEPNPLRAISLLVRNGPFMLIFFGVLMFTGFYATLNKATVYFFEYVVGDRTSARYALAAISLAGILSPLLWVRVTHRTSKRFVWIAGALLASGALAALYVFDLRRIETIVVAYFVAGCGIQAFLMTFFAMTADAIDYGHLRNGRRAEAFGFGFLSFANGTSLAIGGWALGFGLTAIGYTPGDVQTPEAQEGIRAITALAPIVGFLASAAIIAFFPISTKKHREIVSALENREKTAA